MRDGHENKAWLRLERDKAWSKQGCRCAYCLAKIKRYEATADHIKPKASGGTNHKNIAAACSFCNLAKGKLTVTVFKKMIAPRAPFENPYIETIRIIRALNLETDRACKRILASVGLSD